MPALAFLAVVSLVLIAMLFVADATLENVSPPIVTSNRIGLPEPWHPELTDPDLIRNLPTAPAPAPDMASDLVRDTMPKAQSAPEEDLANVKPAARAARAEAPPTKKRVARTRPEYRRTTPGRTPRGVAEFGLSGFGRF